MSIAPTKRQREILEIIAELSAVRPPTFRELGARIGVVSSNAVACHMASLRARGLVEPATRDTTGKSAARDIVLTAAGLAEIGRVEMSASEAAAAYVFDRAEQYDPSSGIHDALCTVAANLARGEHMAARDHGELDDLLERVRKIARIA